MHLGVSLYHQEFIKSIWATSCFEAVPLESMGFWSYVFPIFRRHSLLNLLEVFLCLAKEIFGDFRVRMEG